MSQSNASRLRLRVKRKRSLSFCAEGSEKKRWKTETAAREELTCRRCLSINHVRVPSAHVPVDHVVNPLLDYPSTGAIYGSRIPGICRLRSFCHHPRRLSGAALCEREKRLENENRQRRLENDVAVRTIFRRRDEFPSTLLMDADERGRESDRLP